MSVLDGGVSRGMLADAIIVLIAVWVGAYLKGWGAALIGN
jgi:hypothetical protein